ARRDADRRRKRSKAAIFVAELKVALGSGEGTGPRRGLLWGTALAVVMLALGLGMYVTPAPEQELKDLIASGAYAQAATAAKASLANDPDNQKLRALGTEALLKANVPNWLSLIKDRGFAGAAAAVATMRELAAGNADVQPLLSELAWIGNLAEFVGGRGPGEVTIQIYADEEKIGTLLKQWEDDVQGHQRASTAISFHVPEFKNQYAEALSDVRKLQSDNSVYLTAIERLKKTISTELDRDHPETLDAVLTEYGDKYPRLGGIDLLRQDLHRYIEIDNAVRTRSLGPLIALLATVRFSTPAFQDRLGALAASGRLPPPEVVTQYQTVSDAWRQGATKQAFDGLQTLAGGPWADAAAKDAEHKKAVVEQFAELLKLRGSKAFEGRLLDFYGMLEPTEDVHFINATASDLERIKDQALTRAQELLNRAGARWREYRNNGAIEGPQRLEAEISNQFRSQARLLAEAHEDAQTGTRIYTQLKVDFPEQWRGVRDEIKAEAELQRNSLMDLQLVLAPRLLKTKLALIGGQNDGQ
ncbi:MAG: FHA domain-containing protein, partial [Propionivibrio sp.]